jgi:hypothetical protein
MSTASGRAAPAVEPDLGDDARQADDHRASRAARIVAEAVHRNGTSAGPNVPQDKAAVTFIAREREFLRCCRLAGTCRDGRAAKSLVGSEAF